MDKNARVKKKNLYKRLYFSPLNWSHSLSKKKEGRERVNALKVRSDLSTTLLLSTSVGVSSLQKALVNFLFSILVFATVYLDLPLFAGRSECLNYIFYRLLDFCTIIYSSSFVRSEKFWTKKNIWSFHLMLLSFFKWLGIEFFTKKKNLVEFISSCDENMQ